MHLTVLDASNPEQSFPPVTQALTIPDGLLAVGGCLSKSRLLNAYRHGIFPWNSQDEPILWWSPDPRLVLFPDKLIISRSLAKTLRKQSFKITFDKSFAEVVCACAKPRKDNAGTWITKEIYRAYSELNRMGYAHSVEAWVNEELAGGLYGVAIGQVFFGESMFHTKTDASKAAFVTLVGHLKCWGFKLIDCQVSTHHLISFGAEEIPRSAFLKLLDQYCGQAPTQTAWQGE